jgi:rRNA maturation endonuclease Nob1
MNNSCHLDLMGSVMEQLEEKNKTICDYNYECPNCGAGYISPICPYCGTKIKARYLQNA